VVVWQLALQIDQIPAQLRAIGTNNPNTLAHRNPPTPTNRIIQWKEGNC